MQEKILIYGALIHANQNDNFIENKCKKTITINIIDLDYFLTDDYHKKIIFAEEGMIFHVLELPKFKKSEIQTEEEAWVIYFKETDNKLIEKAKKYEKIDKLDKLLTDYWMAEKF